jgi:uncharacterized protein (DUF3820 family)
MDWNNVICKKCGLINDYTVTESGNQHVCKCNGCGHFLGNKPKEYNYQTIRMPFGKYKDSLICDLEDVRYLEWVIDNVPTVKGNVRKAINFKIGRHERV